MEKAGEAKDYVAQKAQGAKETAADVANRAGDKVQEGRRGLLLAACSSSQPSVHALAIAAFGRPSD